MSLDHLVIVCCHATYRPGGPLRGERNHPYKESSWVLQDFQKSDSQTGKAGEHITFIEHIRAGVSIIRSDPRAYLMFSGGKTQNEVDITEADSYERALSFEDQYGDRICPEFFELERRDTEWHAADSYQNLLFSIVTFKIRTRLWPAKITVITHAFKERRFLELHGPAIKWPADRLRVLGLNPPMNLAELQATQQGEATRGYREFAKDLYGVHSVLTTKRTERGWEREKCLADFMAEDIGDVVRELLEWKGGESGTEVFPGKLPWERDDSQQT